MFTFLQGAGQGHEAGARHGVACVGIGARGAEAKESAGDGQQHHRQHADHGDAGKPGTAVIEAVE